MRNTITLRVKNKSKFDRLLALIRDLDYVEILKNDQGKKNKKISSEDDFFALAGIWKDRNISAKELREKAWPKTK
jgi:hypothetical protein